MSNRGKRGKRERWEENQSLRSVHEPDLRAIVRGETYNRGTWREVAFDGGPPLALELGCGQGLFALDLARRFPGRGHVGVDVKGHRFWRGARRAHDEEIGNVGFLRARIQWIDRFFAPGEVGEIWLTFSDPQVADKRGTKRLTSPYYLDLYASLLGIGGTIRVKTDSPEFYAATIEDAPSVDLEIIERCDDVHGAAPGRFDPELTESLAFRTAYEERWIKEGKNIHYVELRKVSEVPASRLEEARRMLQGPAERNSPRYPEVGRRQEPRAPFGAGVEEHDL